MGRMGKGKPDSEQRHQTGGGGLLLAVLSSDGVSDPSAIGRECKVYLQSFADKIDFSPLVDVSWNYLPRLSKSTSVYFALWLIAFTAYSCSPPKGGGERVQTHPGGYAEKRSCCLYPSEFPRKRKRPLS